MSELKSIVVETLHGKTLGRTLQNLALSEVVLEGCGVDLGSKSNDASYYRFLQITDGVRILFSDLHPQSPDVVRVDLEKEIPLPDGSQDFLLLTNVLEHLYDYRTCLAETYRVLKPGGRLIGAVPYLHKIHPDPDDFFRYSESSLRRMFREAGYETLRIEPLGYGPFTAGIEQFAPVFKLKTIILGFYVLGMLLDGALNRLLPRSALVRSSQFPLNYFFICEKR